MLHSDEVKPLLLHDDPDVREAAGRYFADGYSADPEVAGLLLEGYDRFGKSHGLGGLRACRNLAVTQEAVESIAARLSKTGDDYVATRLSEALERAPVPLLVRNREVILASPNVEPSAAEQISRRCSLAARPAEALWDELLGLWAGHTGDIDDDEGEERLRHDRDLVAILAHATVPDDETLCRQLSSPDVEGTDLDFADLAGLRRCRGAVPVLVSWLGAEDWDRPDVAMEALARIGDPATGGLVVESRGKAADEDYSVYGAELLGAIKHPESEEAILGLLETESNATARTMLCSSLCKLFSERGVPVVMKEIEAGYDVTMLELEDDAAVLHKALGLEVPDLTRQKELSEKKRARRWGLTRRSLARQAPPRGAPAGRDIVPAVRQNPKIGRNSPCPCGSGKKYKRCCGRK